MKMLYYKTLLVDTKNCWRVPLPFKPPDLVALSQALPGIFSILSQVYDDTHPILPTNLLQVDDSIARVNTALDYVYVRATTTDPNIQSRLNMKNGTLVQFLGTRDWRSLRAARDLVEQMRQNIYPEDLIEDLRAKQARVTLDQQVARPYSPLEICICFFRHAYNQAKALEQLSCAWTFGDGLGEKGWAVCHFYQESAKKTITAVIPLTVTALPSAPLVAAGGYPSPHRRPMRPFRKIFSWKQRGHHSQGKNDLLLVFVLPSRSSLRWSHLFRARKTSSRSSISCRR